MTTIGYVPGNGRYRLPVATIRGAGAPGHEVDARLKLLIHPTFEVALGGSVSWVERPVGLDFEQTDMTDPDRFTALRTRYVRAGPKLVLRSVDNLSLVLSPQLTALGRNAPSDLWSVTVGVARFRPSAAGAEPE